MPWPVILLADARIVETRYAGRRTLDDLQAALRGTLARGARSAHEVSMLFLVIETFRGGDPAPVYRRFGERGRMAPEGLTYVGSWVATDLTRCYQLMECADTASRDTWMEAWRDLVDFEVVPVITSAEAAAAVAERSSPAPASPGRWGS